MSLWEETLTKLVKAEENRQMCECGHWDFEHYNGGNRLCRYPYSSPEPITVCKCQKLVLQAGVEARPFNDSYHRDKL